MRSTVPRCIFVTDELDGGPVILQAKVPVFAGDSEDEITARVQAQEHAIYPLGGELVCGRSSAHGGESGLA
ncbi:Phosphoribosylglycinamide formyltransferase [Raoultella planticola]|uniref:Phosphoribosylglycinamide formyltransferase n=1 Tax=Raoultella planticola TaxID=575 RepID=A0A485BXH2_RAOPL|nr:Phosphoribosylglycinamide formyltransferase [Raoultella planticola]